MKMRLPCPNVRYVFGFLGCALMLVACTSAPLISKSPSRISIFDQLASSEIYSNRITTADRDIPGDVWVEVPFHDNSSRYLRVEVIAKDLLSHIQPKLKSMTVSELMRSIKVQDGSGFVTNYIADILYPLGNQMIIAELKSRQPGQLKEVRYWLSDGAYIDTGSNGEGLTMSELAQSLIERRR